MFAMWYPVLGFYQLDKVDQVVKTMIDHMTDVQGGATYKLSLKKGQFIKIQHHDNQLHLST